MIKKLLVFASILFSIISWSQDNTASPYSYYGLGEIKFKGTEDARSMGGISIVSDSVHLNLLNPASHSKLRFLTMAIGSSSRFSTFKTDAAEEKTKRTNLNYLAIAIPLKKFGVAVGLMPYSAVGYQIENIYVDNNGTTDTSDDLEKIKRLNGNGNINRFFIGTSYSINKKFSVGVEIQYNFGSLENIISENLNEPNTLFLSSREKNQANVSGLSLNTGIQYQSKLSNKLSYYTNFTFSPEMKLNDENTTTISTVRIYQNGTEDIIESNDPIETSKKIILPTKIGLGFGIGSTNKWLIGTEFSYTENSKLKNIFNSTNPDARFENSKKIAFGGYYIPKYDSFSSYFNRVTYRAGFRYENSGLVLRNESINDYGITFGLSLPLGLSKINIGFEYGKKGTTAQNLIQENYFNINVGFSLNDLWFRKREIN